MAKGISSVNGNPLPKIGEENFYEVAGFYPGTPIPANSADIKWKLFVEQSGGSWRELRGLEKTGRRVPFNFPQQWYGKKLLIEAYLHSPEMKSPPGIVVMPITGDRKIDTISFFDSNWNALSQTPKYGQTLNVRINTVSMLGETLFVSLWERDTYSDTGHDPSENTNIWGCERDFKVENTNGRVEFPLRLDPAWAVLANKGLWDMMDDEHEYYLLVKGRGAQTKYSVQRNVKDEVATPQSSPGSTGTTSQPTATQPAAPSPLPVDAEQHTPITVGGIGPNPPAPDDATSPVIVEEVITEGIADAYFAKKEFTKLTGEEDGEHTYTFGGTKANNNTSTAANKESIAEAILTKGKVNDTLKPDKKYTTKEAIVAALTANEYGKDTADHKTVTFKTFKLGEEFKKITSAPLEDKVYLVARTYFLEGKTATITVKENDGLIKGSPDAVLPLSEISEANMASTEALTEADRTEKTSFSGTIAKVETGKDDKGEAIISEMYIVPVQLRPKTDADLADWKEKIGKGKEEGKHTYPATKSFTVDNSQELNTISQNIAKNSNDSAELKDKKLIVYAEDIIEILRPQHPERFGEVRYTEVTNIPTYKKVAEELYLNVTASGEKGYNEDFLKGTERDFLIAQSKPIIFPYLVKPENDVAGIHKTYYWAANQNSNQATFNSNRKGGRKHAGRDLYSKPYTEVVAICDGKVLDVSTSFADGTGAVTILHETNDGRKFVIRYGEVENNTVLVKKDDLVKQKDVIGKTGWLRTWYKGIVTGYEVYMLHFEYYNGSQGFDVLSSLSNSSSPFRRRSDLEDGVTILQEGYRNTFEESTDDRVPPSTLSTSEKGKDFIKDYEKFKSNAYNDSEDYCTIGYGYLIAKEKCENITLSTEFANGITRERALELFSNKLIEFENAVKRDIKVNLYQHEFDALISLVYNSGSNFLNTGGSNDGPTQIKIKINKGDYDGGANEFSDVTNGGVPGLVIRRTQEINMFKNKVYDSTH